MFKRSRGPHGPRQKGPRGGRKEETGPSHGATIVVGTSPWRAAVESDRISKSCRLPCPLRTSFRLPVQRHRVQRSSEIAPTVRAACTMSRVLEWPVAEHMARLSSPHAASSRRPPAWRPTGLAHCTHSALNGAPPRDRPALTPLRPELSRAVLSPLTPV